MYISSFNDVNPSMYYTHIFFEKEMFSVIIYDMDEENSNSNEEFSSIDDIGIDLPDIPMPDENAQTREIEDEFEGAYKFAIIGVGQGGSRMAETFWDLGYRRVCVINTAKQDLKFINIPEDRKLLLDHGGAGKNPETAEKIFQDNAEEIWDFFHGKLGTTYDRVLVCAGAGGGTGAGGAPVVFKIVKDNTSASVGFISALPTKAEGNQVAKNAKRTMQKVVEYTKDGILSPLIVLNNEKIKELYPGLSINKFWTTANSSVCSLFHLFNKISSQDSSYTTFDKADLDSVLNSGIITFGATPIKAEQANDTDISKAIRNNLKKNILAGADISTGNIAACVMVVNNKLMDEVPQEALEHGFEQLNRLLVKDNTVHRGIYTSNKPGIAVYTVIGGLEPAKDWFDFAKWVPKEYAG
jgi:cell division GTPase FtsZ